MLFAAGLQHIVSTMIHPRLQGHACTHLGISFLLDIEIAHAMKLSEPLSNLVVTILLRKFNP